MPASRGTPTARVRSGIHDSVTVAIPLASITRWTSPTDRQQNGQAGTSATASTASARRRSMIAGTVSSSNTVGSRMYPMIE